MENVDARQTGVSLHCAKCGRTLASRASRPICNECLVQAALNADSEPGLSPLPADGRMGDFELLEEIARGGMGIVFKAKQTSLNRLVALKLLASGNFAGQAELRRFKLEAQAAALLDHPNIVPIFEVSEHEGRPFFTMKLIEGGSLAERTSRHRTELGSKEASACVLPISVGARVVATVARAVHFAHQRGVLHRDLKPANILLDATEQPFVTDFGLAKWLHADSSLTLSGVALGTPNYMAPEQARGRNQDITTAADIYSLGAILYELIAGEPPFVGNTPLETMRKVVEEEPPRPTSKLPANQSAEINRDLETICLKCLEKEPSSRYGSAVELAEDLERWLRHEPIHARPSRVWEQVWKWTRRKPAYAALTGVSVLALATILITLTVSNTRVRRALNRAVQEEARATNALVRADDQARRAEAGEAEVRRNLYAADVFLAGQALDAGNLGLARRLLDNHKPQPGYEDLRGFEWYHFRHRSAGQPALVLAGHSNSVNCVTFTADSRLLITGGADGTVRFWDPQKGQGQGLLVALPRDTETQLMPEVPEAFRRFSRSALEPGLIRHLALSSDGKLLAASCDVHGVIFWELAHRRILTHVRFAGSGGFISTNRFAVTPGPELAYYDVQKMFVSGPTSQLSDAERDRFFSPVRLGTQTNRSHGLEITSDGRWLGIKSSTNLAVWNLMSSNLLGNFPARDAQTFAVLGPASGVAIATVGRSSVQWWQPDTTTPAREFFGHNHEVTCLAASPDERWLASGGIDQRVCVHDTLARADSIQLHGHSARVNSVAFSPDGHWLASVSDDMTARLWPMPPTERTNLLPSLMAPIALAPNGQRLLARDSGSRVCLLDLNSAKTVPLGDSTNANALPLGFSPDGLSVFTVEFLPNEGFAQLLRLSSTDGREQGRIALQIPGSDHKSKNLLFTLSPDATKLAFGDLIERSLLFEKVLLFDSATGLLARTLNYRRDGGVDSNAKLTFSPDGRLLVAHNHNQTLRWWDLASGAFFTRQIGWAAIFYLPFPPDSRHVALAHADGTIALLALDPQSTPTVLAGHQGLVETLAFSHDGRTLASSGQDGQLKLWHIATHRELATLHSGRSQAALVFTALDDCFCGLDVTGRLRLWSAIRE